MKSRLLTLRAAGFLLFFIFLLLLLLTNTQTAMEGVRQGLSLCTETLFPSLFPFLVLSELLIARNAGELLGRFVGKPISRLFGLSPNGTAALLLGALCGFPVGTTSAVALCERGEISEDELHRLLLFGNNPSSGFLVGAVGGALFGSNGIGTALFFIIWASAAAVGILLRIRLGAVEKVPDIPRNGMKNPPSVKDFTGSVTRGFSAILQVFAFVLFFSCISACLAPILQALQLPSICNVLLCGILEMTSGIHTAVTALSPAAAFRLTAFFSGFAGLSVCLQLFSVAEKYRPRLLPYLGARLAQGTVALGLAEIYLRLVHPAFGVTNSIMTFATNTVQQRSTVGVLLLLPSLILLLSLVSKRKTASPQ